ncbi:MAG: ABC-ATPase domain-containing protein [Trueperaceae bacterium]|nr:ABC-ATPase domain-containing protein [Trueperaceae bacterium]
MTKHLADLAHELRRIDGKGYKAYKDVRGGWRFQGGTLFVDHVQADPFAAPSKLRVRCDRAALRIPNDLDENATQRTALEDFLARRVHAAIGEVRARAKREPTLSIDAGGQAVLERTAMIVRPDFVEARVEVGLPAAGRRVLGLQAKDLLCDTLPELVTRSLAWSPEVDADGRAFVQCVENQEHVRARLREMGLVAFVADGAILPRASGVSDAPLRSRDRVPFESPDALRVTVDLPHPADGPGGTATSLTGMGVPEGVTLVVGGGYHGKSTLLRALEVGVYPHVPGDGREYVISDPDAVKIRAEDRRRIEGVRITPFIADLPDGTDTEAFSTDEASGSTSQAAALIEAVEVGARALLMDEDTCATNLMVRDARMQALVAEEAEPITPLVDRVQELYRELGVSSVLVMGGSGDYLDEADTVIQMEHYRPYEVTEAGRRIAREMPTRRQRPGRTAALRVADRAPLANTLDPSRGKKAVKIDAPTRERLRFGREDVDLRCLDQLVDVSQTRAVGQTIRLAAGRWMDGRTWLREVLGELEAVLDGEGTDALNPFGGDGTEEHPGRFARPRRHEVAAALNRIRTLGVRPAVAQTAEGAPELS